MDSWWTPSGSVGECQLQVTGIRWTTTVQMYLLSCSHSSLINDHIFKGSISTIVSHELEKSRCRNNNRKQQDEEEMRRQVEFSTHTTLELMGTYHVTSQVYWFSYHLTPLKDNLFMYIQWNFTTINLLLCPNHLIEIRCSAFSKQKSISWS